MKNKVIILKPWYYAVLLITSFVGLVKIFDKVFNFMSDRVYFADHIPHLKRK